MRSHIHELWEDLELSPQYPEPGLDRVMDRVMDQIEAEEPEHPASQTRRRSPMSRRNWAVRKTRTSALPWTAPIMTV